MSIGYLRSRTNSFAPGLAFLLAATLLAGILILMLRVRQPEQANGMLVSRIDTGLTIGWNQKIRTFRNQ